MSGVLGGSWRDKADENEFTSKQGQGETVVIPTALIGMHQL